MADQESPKKSKEQIERWLSKAKSAWSEGYDYLMATKPGIQYYDALLAIWLSVGRDDRGSLKTREDFASFIGVSRAVTYQWQERRPEIAEWVKELVEMRFGGTRLADVDQRLYQKASAKNTTVGWVRLFYERARVLGAALKLELSGDEESPLVVKNVDELTDEELANIATKGSR